MAKRTLEQVFNAFFHNKEAFSDFCSLNLEQEVLPFSVNDRDLFRPSERLKKYLRFVDKVILRYLLRDEEVLHSYIKGKSALTAVQAHIGNSHFFTTDIKAFFPNITEENVRSILLRNKDNVPVTDIDEYIDDLAKMMTLEGTLPVGFPTSPQLSNAFLFKFDRAMHQYCSERHFVYTRYSDDLIVSGHSFDGFEQLSKYISELLHKSASTQLQLNADKTRFIHTGNKVKILGLVMTREGKVTIDSRYKKQLETLLHFYVSDKNRFHKIVTETFHGKERSVFGLLHYAKSVDPGYLEKLQRKYGNYAVRELMKDKWNA